MNIDKKISEKFLQASHSKLGWLAVLCALFVSILLVSDFYLFENTAYLDDSFIYLHVAANIAELGTARYFPAAESWMLLSSSPLRLITLVPGFFVLEYLDLPLRTIEAAKFSLFCGGLIAYLCFLPFWKKDLKTYFLLGAGYFLLGASLDTLFLMEGGVLFLSLFSLVKLLTERTENYFALGVIVLLVGLSRPEIGLIAMIFTAMIYFSQPGVLIKILLGLSLGFLVYAALMFVLGVYPIPSTIWSKQLTGQLKLFSDKNLIEMLPTSIARSIGLSWPWVGWVLIGSSAAFSVALRKGAIPVFSATLLLLLFAVFMPGNFVWYSENFLIVFMSLMVGVTIELYRQRLNKMAVALGCMFLLAFSLVVFSGFRNYKNYPWNEGSPMYLAYREVGESSLGDGTYVISRYSGNAVRVRMCEVGIVSFFAGPNSWIYDLCGLVQIGNLEGASESWLRYFYPSSFGETGDDQLARLQDSKENHVIDVWALRSKKEAAGAVGKCKFVDESFCINEYR